MTREEIEQLNESEPYCFETSREEQWYNVGLQEGLKIADSNPKWISIKDDLPCNYPNNIHFGFTDRVLATDGKINIFIALMKNINNKWVWYSDDNFDVQHVVTHWMPLPQPPKEYFEIR